MLPYSGDLSTLKCVHRFLNICFWKNNQEGGKITIRISHKGPQWNSLSLPLTGNDQNILCWIITKVKERDHTIWISNITLPEPFVVLRFLLRTNYWSQGKKSIIHKSTKSGRYAHNLLSRGINANKDLAIKFIKT